MLFASLKSKKTFDLLEDESYDYAIIVTAYQQTMLLPAVVDSILKLKHQNYLVYIVADQCDITNLNFSDPRINVLRPEEELGSNIKSHFYAINRFKRDHAYITIIDSDNLLDTNYLSILNLCFNKGYFAVQGMRSAKNLNTVYACLDEAGDIFYRYTDRKLLFDSGSSASLAGSGMAFTTALYKTCLEDLTIEGAGFDKVLHMEILKRKLTIAFAEKAIVYDEKISKSDQLVKQRARWINTWFKYASEGFLLVFTGLKNGNKNQILAGILFARPPLFIIAGFTLLFLVLDLFFASQLLWFWFFTFVAFLLVFFSALRHFNAPKSIYKALIQAPKFIFLQVLALFKARKANELSKVTTQYHNSKIDEL
ncbi:glycosyltransferase [Pedobacter sp. MW01-1-1]|uniref:glycosyltransferase n=1 Tax=Pedobacter sp. MW01-1-1 TaxID=3383027 RepID=UPI003FEE56AD